MGRRVNERWTLPQPFALIDHLQFSQQCANFFVCLFLGEWRVANNFARQHKTSEAFLLFCGGGWILRMSVNVTWFFDFCGWPSQLGGAPSELGGCSELGGVDAATAADEMSPCKWQNDEQTDATVLPNWRQIVLPPPSTRPPLIGVSVVGVCMIRV